MSATCGCGCGEPVMPGRKFRPGHASRLRPPRQPAQFTRCQQCEQKVRLRVDGSLGRHYQKKGSRTRVLCPEGLLGHAPTPQAVRVKITLDVVIPAAWSRPELRQNVQAALQERAEEAFLIAIESEEPQ